MNNQNYVIKRSQVILVGVGILAFIVVIFLTQCFKTVPAGHVAVATIFGKVNDKPYEEGLHFPVNPLYQWTLYDARQKTIKETAGVPSQDQLTTMLEVSVQYRVNKEMASVILQETGTTEEMIQVHLIPKFRSALREQGKSIVRAEDFFKEETQMTMQNNLALELKDSMAPKGILVQEVLLRDIRLPQFITRAIEQKKEREQEVEKQKAELERFKTEQEQKLVQAEAERKAAEQEAEKKKLLADAQAYEIEKINEAISNNQAYIQLKALESLQAISKDPAAKMYFMNGESAMPLPLLHMGDINK